MCWNKGNLHDRNMIEKLPFSNSFLKPFKSQTSGTKRIISNDVYMFFLKKPQVGITCGSEFPKLMNALCTLYIYIYMAIPVLLSKTNSMGRPESQYYERGRKSYFAPQTMPFPIHLLLFHPKLKMYKYLSKVL